MDEKVLKQRIIFRRIIQFLIVFAIFLMAINNINQENDFHWQLKMGEEIWTKHYFPTRDIFSHAAYGQVWTLHEWIPSVIFYLIFNFFGPAPMVLFKTVLIVLTFFFFLVLFNKFKVNLYLSLFFLFLAAMVNTRGVWSVFPSIFEYFFLALTLFILEYFKGKAWVPVFLVVLSLIWANSHGSFLLLPIILGSYVAGSILARKLKERFSGYDLLGVVLTSKEIVSFSLVTAISLLTPLLTPNGFWTYLYPFRITFGRLTNYVSEYQKFWTVWVWDFGDFVHGFTLILLLTIFILFLVSLRRLYPTDVFLALIFGMLALTAVRHVAIFALVALYLIAKYLTVWFGEYRGIFKRTLVKDILAILFIISFIFFYKTRLVPFGLAFSEVGYPKAAAELINESQIPGNMFNHYNYGGYLIWKMPNYKVFVDGRLEMYEGQVGDDYKTILAAGQGYKELMSKYQINFFINYLTDEINEKLVDDSDWKPVFNDEKYVVFVKKSKPNSKLIGKYWNEKYEEYLRQNIKALFAMERADYYESEGVRAVKKGDLLTALGFFQTALSYDPSRVSLHLNIAAVSWQIGSFEQAKQEYEYVLKIEPGNQKAKKGLEIVEKDLKENSAPKIE